MTHTKNKSELAKLCNVSRPTLYSFLEQEGAPKEDSKRGWNVEAVRDFILQNTSKEAVSASLDSDIADLKKWDIYERARKSKIANDAKDGKSMPKSEHRRIMAEVIGECQRVLDGMARELAPDVVGVSVVSAESAIQAKVDEAISKLHHG